jgi:hypothetical protein
MGGWDGRQQARSKLGAEEMWLVCSNCNQQLETDTTFKNAKDPEFKAYQSALKQYLDRIDDSRPSGLTSA